MCGFFSGNGSPEPDFQDGVLEVRAIATGDLILTEVVPGFRHDKDYKTAKRLLEELSVFEPPGTKMANRSADNVRTLHKKGFTIRKTADVIIASFCIEYDLALLFSDTDFKPLVKISDYVMQFTHNEPVEKVVSNNST